MSGKYALIIGNTEYTDPGLAQLTAPGRDAEDFARVLRSPEIGGFDKVFTLINRDVFLVNQAIDDFFTHKKPDELLLLYFSGHGVRDENGLLYLAVKNTNRTRLRSTAINSAFIRDAMDHSRSKRQILILDCCNSGAFAQGTKSVTGGSMGTATAFEGTGYGRVVLTASDATQFAWEGDQVIGQTDNSLFTHFLVKGLEGEADQDGDGRITVDELYDYAYEQIIHITPNQTPGKWSYKQQGEIFLRESTRMEAIRPTALPTDLLAATANTLPFVREAAVKQLEQLLKGKNIGLAHAARTALEKIAAEDDSRSIAQLAKKILESTGQSQPLESQNIKKNTEESKNVFPEQKIIERLEQPAPQVQSIPAPQIPKVKTLEQPRRLSMPKAMPMFVGIPLVFVVCLLGILMAKPFVFPPSATATATQNQITPTTEILTFTSVPSLTITPFSPKEPDQFFIFYFETIISKRDYELAWSLLSEKYKLNNNLAGFADYKDTWEKVLEWQQPTLTLKYLTPTKAIVSTSEMWFRATKWYSLPARGYCLIRDETRNTWMFEYKGECGL